jgi:hypothetical protein
LGLGFVVLVDGDFEGVEEGERGVTGWPVWEDMLGLAEWGSG